MLERVGALITRSSAATRNWFENTENCRTKWTSSASRRLSFAEPAGVSIVGDDAVMKQFAIDPFEEFAKFLYLGTGKFATL